MRSQILNTDPLPNLDKVFANVLREENYHDTVVEPEIKVEGITFVAKNSNRPLCDYCGKLGIRRMIFGACMANPQMVACVVVVLVEEANPVVVNMEQLAGKGGRDESQY